MPSFPDCASAVSLSPTSRQSTKISRFCRHHLRISNEDPELCGVRMKIAERCPQRRHMQNESFPILCNTARQRKMDEGNSLQSTQVRPPPARFCLEFTQSRSASLKICPAGGIILFRSCSYHWEGKSGNDGTASAFDRMLFTETHELRFGKSFFVRRPGPDQHTHAECDVSIVTGTTDFSCLHGPFLKTLFVALLSTFRHGSARMSGFACGSDAVVCIVPSLLFCKFKNESTCVKKEREDVSMVHAKFQSGFQ